VFYEWWLDVIRIDRFGNAAHSHQVNGFESVSVEVCRGCGGSCHMGIFPACVTSCICRGVHVYCHLAPEYTHHALISTQRSLSVLVRQVKPHSLLARLALHKREFCHTGMERGVVLCCSPMAFCVTWMDIAKYKSIISTSKYQGRPMS